MGKFPKGLIQNEQKKKVDWTLTDKVRGLARSYYDLHKVKPLNNRTLFHSTIFSLLAARQKYDMQQKVHSRLLAYGYGEPEKIIAEKDSLLLRRIMCGASMPNEKRRLLVKLATYWGSDDLGDRVIDDCINGQANERSLRSEVVDKIPGVREKGAAMLFGHIGYDNMVPIDTHISRYLREHGHDCPVFDNLTQGALQRKLYHQFEQVMRDHAKEKGMTPFMYQVAMWIIGKKWIPSDYIDPNSFDFKSQQNFWNTKELQSTVPETGIVTLPSLIARGKKTGRKGHKTIIYKSGRSAISAKEHGKEQEGQLKLF